MKIEEGKFVSVVGSSGSGKTSMLNLICGSIDTDAEKIIANGADITGKKEYLCHKKTGRVFQEPAAGTCHGMTILENMSIADHKRKGCGLGRCLRKIATDRNFGSAG